MGKNFYSFLSVFSFVIIFQSFSQPHHDDQLRVKIKLRLGQTVESISELYPGIKFIQIQNEEYEAVLDARTLHRLRPEIMGYEILQAPSSVFVSKKSFKPQPTSPKALIQEMVDSVSIDSLRSNILALQNFGTRYEYTPQQDSAGVYIFNQFVRWGLQTKYDTFAFGTTHLYDIDFIYQDSAWIVGTAGMIVATTNGGQTWISNNSTITSNLYGVDFVSRTTGFAVGDAGMILRTTDGGTTWTIQNSGVSNTLYDVNFVNDQLGLVVGISGCVLRTTDGGTTWSNISSGTTQTLRELQFVDAQNAWAVGGTVGANSTILHSTNGGLTWSLQIPPTGVSAYLRAVNFVNSQYGWIAGDEQTILKTTNGGTIWTRQNPPTGAGSTLRGVSFVDILRGWVVDYDGRILTTSDGGTNWTIQYSHQGSRLLNLKTYSDHHITVCGTNGNLSTSTNGGTAWSRQTSGLPAQYIHVSRNIVATIPGRVTPEKECVVTGHYDSYSNNPFVSAPGANDNATGTCSVLEAARICKNYQFESTIKFVTVSAEELGLYGSDHFAFEARDQGRAVIGAINADMIGYPTTSDTTRLVIASYQAINRLVDSADIYNQRYNIGLTLEPLVDNSGASDYAPFAFAGYDALEIAEATANEIWGGADPYYHKTTDTFDKLKPSLVRRGAQLMLASVAELAKPPLTQSYQVENRWNIVSLPVKPNSSARLDLFPTALSDAFGFDGNYDSVDTLDTGKGYWIKFGGAQSVPMNGFPITSISIDVVKGWNLIGSISQSIPVSVIMSDPSGIITTRFFGYNNGYATVDTLLPCRGYWVKVNQSGSLILSSSYKNTTLSRIQIIPTSELPPAPPANENTKSEIVPLAFALRQNYPNPFNPSTTISFELPKESFATLRVFNLLGQTLATLVNEKMKAGVYQSKFDAARMPSGIYFYQLNAGDFVQIKKLILMK
jgi:photosystem II stability/assembly factor-like uncharacterized protein